MRARPTVGQTLLYRPTQDNHRTIKNPKAEPVKVMRVGRTVLQTARNGWEDHEHSWDKHNLKEWMGDTYLSSPLYVDQQDLDDHDEAKSILDHIQSLFSGYGRIKAHDLPLATLRQIKALVNGGAIGEL